MVVPAQMSSFTYGTAAAFVLLVHAVVVAVSLPGNGGRCPSSSGGGGGDINAQADGCLDTYRAFEDRYQLSGSHIFTSVDVEIIRTLCSDLKTSMRCLKSLRDRCTLAAQRQHQQQQQQHGSQIDAAIRPYLSVVELCDIQHLYEEYAMNQNCLHGQRDVSDQCYRTFLTQTERSSKSTEHAHLQHYCAHLTQLMTCVRSNFALSCGETAAGLVQKLVKAAVVGSHRCRNGSTSHTHESTVSPQKFGRAGSLRRSNGAEPLQCHSFNCRSTQLIVASVTLTLYSVLLVNAFGN